MKKAGEIDNLTGCVVRLEILPTWPQGATKQYVSEKFQNVQDSSTNSHQQHQSLNLKLVIHLLIHHMYLQKNQRKQQKFRLTKTYVTYAT